MLETWTIPGDLVAYRVAAPAPRAALLLVHGFAEHAGRHERTLEHLAARGISAYAYDQRGHGRSPGRRAIVARFDAWVIDALRVLDDVAADAPGLPLFLMGASMGGLLAIRAAQRRPAGLAGVIAVAPALSIAGGQSAFAKAIAPVLARVAPSLPVAKLEVNVLSRDPAVGAAFLADPLTFKGGFPVRTGVEMVAAGAAAFAEASRWTLPLLVVQGDRDRIVSPHGGPRFVDEAGGSDRTLRTVAGGYHEPFNDPGGDALVDEVADWILARTRAAA